MPASMIWGSEWRSVEISVDSLSAVGTSSLEAGLAGVANHLLADDDDDDDDEDDERDDDDDRDDDRDEEEDDDDDDDDDERKGKDHKDDDERDEKHKHKDKDKGKDKDDDDDGRRGRGNPKDKQDPPRPHSVTVDEDSSVAIILERNSANSDSATFAIVEQPSHGSLEGFNSTSGEVTYRPSSNFFGEDSFAFLVREGDRDGRPTAVEIQVKGVNDAPLAAGIQFTTREGRSFSFVLKGFDVDGDALKFIIMSPPDHGELIGAAPNLSYKPDDRFDGVDDFTFKVSDGILESKVASVAITIKEDDDNSRSWQKPRPAPTAATPSTQTESGGSATPTSFEPPLTVLPVDSPAASPAPSLGTIDPGVIVGGTVGAITDLVAPQLIFPASTIEAIATSLEGTIVNYSVRATDDTDGEVETSCSPNSGSKLPVGRFNVVCYATDAAGNSALSSFVVIVRPDVSGDGALPPILLPSILAAVLGAGAYVGLRMYRRNGSLW